MRTAFLLLALCLSAAADAQLHLGPSVRGVRLDGANKTKFGFGLQLTEQLGHRTRLTLDGYWTPWRDAHYSVPFTPATGSSTGPSVETRFEYTHWALNIDLERSMGARGWFWTVGLGHSAYRLVRTEVATGLGPGIGS